MHITYFMLLQNYSYTLFPAVPCLLILKDAFGNSIAYKLCKLFNLKCLEFWYDSVSKDEKGEKERIKKNLWEN